jgi:hypothetical protein
MIERSLWGCWDELHREQWWETSLQLVEDSISSLLGLIIYLPLELQNAQAYLFSTSPHVDSGQVSGQGIL